MWSRRVIVLASLVALAGYVFVYTAGRAPTPIRSDAFSYYVYLPAWAIYHDPSLEAVARDCCGGEFPSYTAIIRWPATGRWVNAHPIGVALMQAPLFAVAHALTKWTNLSPDGFTLYYEHAAGLSGTLAIVAGLYVLCALLRRHFSDAVTAATLAAVFLGTNLYHYATFDSGWSHPYSFFLFACCLYLTEELYTRPARTTPVLLGIVAGLIVLTRHTNVLFPVILVLMGGSGRPPARVRALAAQWRRVVPAAGVAGVVLLPQIWTYYRATGSPFISAYGDRGFTFASPHLYGVLFSVQKGLFFWSPILLLACAGLARLWWWGHATRGLVLAGVAFLAINTYLIASWWDWQFGGSFGHRGFTDALPVFGLGLAGFYEWASRRRLTTVTVAIVSMCLVGLSLFLMAQYWYGHVPYQDTTWAEYKAIFRWR